MRTAVFSIISPNYRHYARVLMASVREHQPDWERFVLLVGDTPSGELDGQLYTSVRLDTLALPDSRRFTFRYTVLELNTAVKPWMFSHLFERGYDRVVFLDPDIVVFSPLAELDEQPAAFLSVTPHLTGPIGGEDHPSERTILQAGSYNLGFLAVTQHPALKRFLGWWQEKLEYHCVVDIANGLFVDQKWMDLAPGLYPDVAILRHDGYNVAYWNLRQRRVTIDGERVSVNGQPLRFFHFSGFDPRFPHLLSRHEHGSTTDDADAPAKLFEAYAIALRDAGSDSFRNASYGFGSFSDGSRISDAARAAYRNSKELQLAAGEDPANHPELFVAYHEVRRGQRAAKMALQSYRFLSRARPLVGLLPRSLRTTMREYLLGRRDVQLGSTGGDVAQPEGLNIVGYVQRATGVGESARLCERSCEVAGLASQVIDVDRPDGGVPSALYRASIYHINADQLHEVSNQFPKVFESSAYNIGCWHWELPEFPDAWIPSANLLNEIWAPSAFIQSSVSRKVAIPVVHMSHGVEVSEVETCTPQELGVPAGCFTFLCMFDFGSVMQRKNPFAAVEAFRRAFPAGSAAALLLKTSNGSSWPEDHAELRERVHGMRDVYLADGTLSRARVNGLLAATDAVVSLHRSEGFGLILAEAMSLGKPVVATGWSGNMDFMTPTNSCPVGFDIVALDRTHRAYEMGQHWAEPDVEHAAALMRRLFDDAAWRGRIGAAAEQTIRTRFSPAAAGMRYIQRLHSLGLLGRAGR
jgi:glycosyltransferase involved in cell wall biosynthesis